MHMTMLSSSLAALYALLLLLSGTLHAVVGQNAEEGVACTGLTTAVNTTGFGSFETIHLGPRCGSGNAIFNTGIPQSVNWRLVAADYSLLAVSMTPADVFTPVVKDGELYFELVPESWPGSGEIG